MSEPAERKQASHPKKPDRASGCPEENTRKAENRRKPTNKKSVKDDGLEFSWYPELVLAVESSSVPSRARTRMADVPASREKRTRMVSNGLRGVC